ncbi:MAG: bifunctional anthranilate synthase component II/anthranilate phosphoribosyltransferase [Ignavibacteriales bacterium]|nr:bifunctional anthranilate synthase component II/anthranilate phosphoribosyltransferase [Ignavibacteriales bacterium]
MILIIDNYDSFTYNLVQLIAQHTDEYEVFRNDKISVDEIANKKPYGILLSPGPKRPEDAGVCVEIIRTLGNQIPIFGVCLGLQSIGFVFGGNIIRAKELMHGKTSMIHHDGKSVFENIPNPFIATRYHSLVIDENNFPTELEISATTNDRTIMAARHKTLPIEGVQFHPESILTTEGTKIISNWMKQVLPKESFPGISSEPKTIKDFIKIISDGKHLSRTQAQEAMRIIISGDATEAQISAFCIAEKMKGETAEELFGFVSVMREKSVKIFCDNEHAIDMCGTGGDNSGTFNISTVASFVVAGYGISVAKHGNRSVSSLCGSADVLKELGVNISLSPEQSEQCLREIGIAFLFAPTFHPAMKHAAKPRSELGMKTFFNMLGPMANPANVQRQLVGTFSLSAAQKISETFSKLGTKKVCVVCSNDGLDEVSLSSATTILEVKNEKISEWKFHPNDVGFELCSIDELKGNSAKENSVIALRILNGEKSSARNIVVLNAAFGLYVADKVKTIQEGISLAENSIYSGNAMKKLKELINFTMN